MAKALPLTLEAPHLPVPVAPSAERWAAMSQRERDAFIDEAIAALHQEELRVGEGSPHSRAKAGIRQVLGEYFSRIGRKIYLASELQVHYPGEPVFAPDLIAVADVEDPGDDDTRMAWIVATEGRGPDLALEVNHQGDRKKDLMDNVVTFARLGISEYVIYDRLKQRVLGYRLPFPGAGRYQPMVSRGGLLSSAVLGLDLRVVDGRLRFFYGGAAIPETRELLARVTAMVDELEQKAEAEAQRADLEAHRAAVAAQRADAEARRADAEAAARAELERRLAELMARLPKD